MDTLRRALTWPSGLLGTHGIGRTFSWSGMSSLKIYTSLHVRSLRFTSTMRGAE